MKYSSDLVTIAAGGRISPNKIDDSNRAYLGAIIKPIGDPLEITAGAVAYSLGDFSDTNGDARIKGSLSGNYKTDGDNAGSFIVYAGANIMYHMFKDSALGWNAELNADYWAADILKVGIGSAYWSSVKDADNGWEGNNNKDADFAVAVEVTPRVTFKLAGNAEIYAYYRLNVHALADDNLEHKVSVNFSWSF
ncbi:hypothetical protein FACS189461_2060 [Spirochaetia bacterium]|nr:hypothetical protein FACS189461_2060 [Spirochaetia bacterium]